MSTQTEVININPEIIEEDKLDYIAKIYKSGKLIVFPTETFYGLGTNPYIQEAVIEVYKLKRRVSWKPFPIIIANKKQIDEVAQEIPKLFYHIQDKFWPGPLTIILKAKPIFPKEMLGENETIGIRIPDFLWLRILVERANCPLIATSANISGEKEISDPNELMNIFYGKVDLIVKGGKTLGKKPSTVLDLTEKRPKIMREGMISKNNIFEFIKKIDPDIL